MSERQHTLSVHLFNST